MDAGEFARQIRGAWSATNKLGTGRALISPTSLPVDDEYRDVLLDPDATYEKIYRTGLSRSQYNILLLDYSYLQYTLFGADAWRLAYWPNPWITGVQSALEQLSALEALETEGRLSHEETSSRFSEMEFAAAVPPIRFEYAADQYVELIHPAAHFHIGRHSENRWPCAVRLGPLSFTLLVSKLYYPNYWDAVSMLQGATIDVCIEEDFQRAIDQSYAVYGFSEAERRSLHFGRSAPPAEAGRVSRDGPPRKWWRR
jgi:hypothetical protein